jgi:hypothetical protein
MEELRDSIRRPNLRTMGIEEGEEVQAKGIHNIFNKIITENFPNLEKVLHIQVQEASRTSNRLDQNRISPQHIIIKTIITENRERILKAVREKKTNNVERKPIKITADFSMETLKARWPWSEVFQAPNENNFNPGILFPAKLMFKIDRAIKIFHNKQKLNNTMAAKSASQRFYKEFCTQKKANKTMREWELSNHGRRKDK